MILKFMLIAFLAILVLLVLWFLSVYNFFVGTKARIKASTQEIGNQLKRQAELIPNLEDSTKGYLKHERGIFETLTEARKEVAKAVQSGDLQKMADAASKVANVLPTLKIAVEDNPELKGSEVVTRLMDELRDTSDKVMYARRTLIDLTADYNVKRVTFPSNLVAQAFGFGETPGVLAAQSGAHVEVSEEELKTPKVSL